MFSWRKGHIVTIMLEEYLEKAEKCLAIFRMSFETYLARGLSEQFDEFVDKTHMAESTCDDIRRRIEKAFYSNALIPESRGDILKLLERLDKVPNRMEKVLFSAQSQLLTAPGELHAKLKQLCHINCDCASEIFRAVKLLFAEPEKIRELADDVDKLESASDRLQREIIKMIFSSDNIKPDQKILLKELVNDVGKISDAAENIADNLNVVVVKRLI